MWRSIPSHCSWKWSCFLMNAKSFQVWTIWQALSHTGPKCHCFSQSEGNICLSWAQNVVRGRWKSFWRLSLKSSFLSRLHHTWRPWPLGWNEGNYCAVFTLCCIPQFSCPHPCDQPLGSLPEWWLVWQCWGLGEVAQHWPLFPLYTSLETDVLAFQMFWIWGRGCVPYPVCYMHHQWGLEQLPRIKHIKTCVAEVMCVHAKWDKWRP